MGKIVLQRKEVASIVLRSEVPGSRAVFLVETRSADDRRKVRELFEALGEFGEVVPLAVGPMMAYVVQIRSDVERFSAGGLFSKIEATLKEEFPFSLAEQSFNGVVYHLIESLCADSDSRLQPVPRCGICNELDPFPTRITLRDRTGQGIMEACYCLRCAAQQAEPSDRELVAGLLSADRRGFHAIAGADLVEWPAEIEGVGQLPTYRLAS